MSQHADNEGRTCWICLDGGTDEGGRSLLRECSCRGSAGYVHTSCLIGYAQHKTKNDYESQPAIKSYEHAMKFRQPWEECPNCNQYYDDLKGGCEQFYGAKGRLVVDLADAFVDFVEWNYADNISYILESLFLNLEVQSRKGNFDATVKIGTKMIFIINQLKRANPPPPPRGRILRIEPHVYNSLGIIHMKVGNDEESVRCFQNYLQLCREVNLSVANAEMNLDRAMRSLTNGQNIISSEKSIENLKFVYDIHRGKDSTDAIRHGINYANELKKAYYGLAFERLLMELSAMSRRVHGPDHKETKKLTISLQERQRRIVSVYGPGQCLALRYEGRNNHCLLVRGPIIEPEHKQVTFKTKKYIPVPGTPVIIEGMQYPNTHLNGKVGELQSWDKESHCFTVLFEDKSLDPCSIHKKKVRILFELPP